MMVSMSAPTPPQSPQQPQRPAEQNPQNSGKNGEPRGSGSGPGASGSGASGPGRGKPLTDEQRSALSMARLFALALLVVVLLAVFAPPWPWPILVTVLAAATVVLGVVSLVRLRKAKVRGLPVLSTLIGMIMAAFMTLSSAGQLVFWEAYQDFAECRSSAITQQATQLCQARLEQAIETRTQELMDSVRP
ncbi:hypothetical protein EDD31_2026 [Bogoriella caseilytica]|uniref:Uncharacterized protein n=2 Tax=Bogoriella caseilytica TaxID=56055 RepID=A0A3N2BEH1_9MICO|nr:hypothetical protein EDD31_2026 [Bogoriella caseilytica]